MFNNASGHSAKYNSQTTAAPTSTDWMQFAGTNSSYLRFDGDLPADMGAGGGAWSALAWLAFSDPNPSFGIPKALSMVMVAHSGDQNNPLSNQVGLVGLNDFDGASGFVDFPTQNVSGAANPGYTITDARDSLNNGPSGGSFNVIEDQAVLYMIRWDNFSTPVANVLRARQGQSAQVLNGTQTGTTINSAFAFWGGTPDATSITDHQSHLGHMRNIMYYNSAISNADFQALADAGPYGANPLPGTPYIHLVDSEVDTSGNGRDAVNVGVTTGVSYTPSL